jgi:hypothetical protein
MNTMQLSNRNMLRAEEMISPRPVFGHSTLAQIGGVARDTADRIRARHQEQIAAIIENGLDLITMKDQLGDELFLAWLQAQRGMNEHMARKYMRLALEFGDKIEIVSDLPLAVLYKLVARATPTSVRTAVLRYLAQGQRLAPDEVDRLIMEGQRAEERVKEVEKRVQKAEREAKKAEREAKLTPQQRARRERRNAKIARLRQAGGTGANKSSIEPRGGCWAYCDCPAGQALRKSDGLIAEGKGVPHEIGDQQFSHKAD